jgi:hypothetical protein
VVDPGIEGGLLVIPRFDVERWCEIKVWVGPGSILAGVDEPIVEHCLVVAMLPRAGPFEESLISIGLCPILVDAVIPLRVGYVIGSVTE